MNNGRWKFWAMVLAVAASGAAAEAPALPTGPKIGSRIPAFSLEDQNGKKQNLRTLAGPKGLVLAFIRSADW